MSARSGCQPSEKSTSSNVSMVRRSISVKTFWNAGTA